LETSEVSEIIFLVEEADEGGFTAQAVNQSIFTEGDSLDELRRNVREAVDCHFDEGNAPKIIRLHIVREEILTA
jgi:predicted RNase H-like HicB family nuclease